MGVMTVPQAESQRVAGGLMTGPASYVTNGFTFDPGGFSSVKFFSLSIVTRGTLNFAEFFPQLNLPVSGQVKIIVKRLQFDKLATSTSGITTTQNPPTGVTVQGTSGQTVANDAHTHAVDHDHAVSTSGANNTASGAVLAGIANITNHTHDADPPNFTGATGTGAHNHAWNNLYQHQHTLVTTSTLAQVNEVANGTDLSGSSWRWFAGGQ